jgi:hypothetical protein
MDKRILVDREVNTADFPELPRSWYAPREYFQRFASVKDVEIFNTTSSAGDWEGYIVQKIGKRSYVIMFSQENNYPYAGFTARTDDRPLISFEGEMDSDEIGEIINMSMK